MKLVKDYLRQIGRRGGLKSRRALAPATARDMVRVREARRAFRRFRTTCFWSYRPDLVIGLGEVPWVVEQLRRYGNREAWRVAARLLGEVPWVVEQLRRYGNREAWRVAARLCR